MRRRFSALAGPLMVMSLWPTPATAAERPVLSVVELGAAVATAPSASHRLSPPRELRPLGTGTERHAYLIPGEGVTLVASTVEGLLVRWIDLGKSTTYGLLEPRIALSHFEIQEDLTAIAVQSSYRLPGDGTRPDHLSSFVGICRIADGVPVADCQQVDVWQAEIPDDERQDAFAIAGAVRAADTPPRYALACLRTRDHDDDGWRDLILERHWGKPSTGADTSAAELEPDLLWMRFDPERQRFLTGRPITDLEPLETPCCTGQDPAGCPPAGSISG